MLELELEQIDEVVEKKVGQGVREEAIVLLVATRLLLAFVVLHVQHQAPMADGQAAEALGVLPSQ